MMLIACGESWKKSRRNRDLKQIMEERNIYVQINQTNCESAGIPTIPAVKHFIYLGSVVQKNGSSDIEIEKD
jgi:hypothetical protein